MGLPMGLPPKVLAFHKLPAETRITILQLCNTPKDIQSLISASPHMLASFKAHRHQILRFWFSEIQTLFSHHGCFRTAKCVARKRCEYHRGKLRLLGSKEPKPTGWGLHGWQESLTTVASLAQLVIEIRGALLSAHRPGALDCDEEERVDILVSLSSKYMNDLFIGAYLHTDYESSLDTSELHSHRLNLGAMAAYNHRCWTFLQALWGMNISNTHLQNVINLAKRMHQQRDERLVDNRQLSVE
ncbi:hypothetical protein ACHAPU_007526 [Fusarium lateritium]